MAEQPQVDAEVASKRSEISGPIPENKYKDFARGLVADGLQNGQLNKEARERMWDRYAQLEAAFQKRVEEGSGSIDAIAVLEEEIWKIRQELGSAYAENGQALDWATYRDRNAKGELKGKPGFLALDDHHLEVEGYSKDLLSKLREAAKKSGKDLPLPEQLFTLIPEMMRFHDIFKWLSKPADKDSLPCDHEEQVRNFVEKHFVGQKVKDMDGNEVTITPEIASFMAKALGNHENIFEEKVKNAKEVVANWKKIKASEKKKKKNKK
jgi:hypothetical protein